MAAAAGIRAARRLSGGAGYSAAIALRIACGKALHNFKSIAHTIVKAVGVQALVVRMGAVEGIRIGGRLRRITKHLDAERHKSFGLTVLVFPDTTPRAVHENGIGLLQQPYHWVKAITNGSREKVHHAPKRQN